jgi:hypothetical protein
MLMIAILKWTATDTWGPDEDTRKWREHEHLATNIAYFEVAYCLPIIGTSEHNLQAYQKL